MSANATPSVQYRVLGLAGAVAAGIGLWRFTSGDWRNGVACVLVVVVVVVVYVVGQRRLKSRGGGRRY